MVIFHKYTIQPNHWAVQHMGWKGFSPELSIQFMIALSQSILTLLLWASEWLGENVCFQWLLHCSVVLWLLVLCRRCCVGCHHPHILDTPLCSHYPRCSWCAVQSGWVLLRSLIAICLMADKQYAACYLNREAEPDCGCWSQDNVHCLSPKHHCKFLVCLMHFPTTELLDEGSWLGFRGGDLNCRVSRGTSEQLLILASLFNCCCTLALIPLLLQGDW